MAATALSQGENPDSWLQRKLREYDGNHQLLVDRHFDEVSYGMFRMAKAGVFDALMCAYIIESYYKLEQWENSWMDE